MRRGLKVETRPLQIGLFGLFALLHTKMCRSLKWNAADRRLQLLFFPSSGLIYKSPSKVHERVQTRAGRISATFSATFA